MGWNVFLSSIFSISSFLLDIIEISKRMPRQNGVVGNGDSWSNIGLFEYIDISV